MSGAPGDRPAFPNPSDFDRGRGATSGMSVRLYLAGQIASGLLGASLNMTDRHQQQLAKSAESRSDEMHRTMAKAALSLADALIEEAEK